MEYVYSFNEDEFMDIDDLENEIEERNSEDENIKVTHVYRGEKITQTNSMFVSGSRIVEEIADRADDEGGEWAESYREELEQKKHYKNIEKLVTDYLDENVGQPSFYLVENVKEVPIKDI